MSQKRILSFVLALVMIVSVSAGVLTAVAETISSYETATPNVVLSNTAQTCVAMSVGSDENDRNFTWYFNSANKGYLDIAERNGDTFPSEYATYESTVAYSSVRSC